MVTLKGMLHLCADQTHYVKQGWPPIRYMFSSQTKKPHKHTNSDQIIMSDHKTLKCVVLEGSDKQHISLFNLEDLVRVCDQVGNNSPNKNGVRSRKLQSVNQLSPQNHSLRHLHTREAVVHSRESLVVALLSRPVVQQQQRRGGCSSHPHEQAQIFLFSDAAAAV